MGEESSTVIAVRGLHKTLGTQEVLRGIDLDVTRGQTCVVLGRSGCGKSVLLRHLIGLLKPTRGKVLIDGFERFPQSQQNRYGCDRLRVTLLNRSTATVSSVTVGFMTYWYPENDSGTGTRNGRDVTINRSVAIPAGAKQVLAYDVCLPEHRTRNVFAEAVSTSWVWARA